ncbi:MAG: IS66 family insertion sequence element accessory protein TnpA [Pirellulaceae bacterium]
MLRGSNPVKLREWEKRLKRFEQSSQAVAVFCLAEAVSQQSFYRWKQRLAGAASRKTTKLSCRRSARPADPPLSFRSVVVVPSKDDAAHVKINKVLKQSHLSAVIK